MPPPTPDPERTPVVIASGQALERTDLVNPVDLMVRACESALADVPALRDRIDRLSVVDVMTKVGPAPAVGAHRRGEGATVSPRSKSSGSGTRATGPAAACCPRGSSSGWPPPDSRSRV